MLIIHGIMIIYHGYNNPVYNVHKNVDVHFIEQKQYICSDPTSKSGHILWPWGIRIYINISFVGTQLTNNR